MVKLEEKDNSGIYGNKLKFYDTDECPYCGHHIGNYQDRDEWEFCPFCGGC